MSSSYEFDTTMECRDNGVLCGVVNTKRGRGYYYFFYDLLYIFLLLCILFVFLIFINIIVIFSPNLICFLFCSSDLVSLKS